MIELPPLRFGPMHWPSRDSEQTDTYLRPSVEARERILQARIAELERLWQSAEARYAEADAAAMSHAKRIAELERQLSAALEAHDSVHDALSSVMKENAELEADAERRNMLRNADRTRSRCYHFVVSLGELGICGNEQAAAAFMATAKEMRAPHVGRKQIKRIAQEASGGVFGNHDDPYVDAEAIDAARGKA